MIQKLFLLAIAQVIVSQLSAQQIVWTTELDSCASASSPRLTDLNGDGVLDVVIGDGIFDDINNLGHVNALDGVDGSLLWRRTLDYDKFNSALFYDFSGDQIMDIVISGRFPQLLALDGTDGSTLWEFDDETFVPPTGWKHFYNQQLLPDLNSDQIPEILAANGGEQDSLPNSVSRPPGFLMVIDGSDGSLVSHAVVPDSAEVYCAPVVHDIDADEELEIIFGTGGETHPGSLWIVELSDLLNGDVSNATNLAQNQNKGFLGSPALADMNNDGQLDILGSSYDGYLTVINGADLSELWRFEIANAETYVTPAIGYFDSDQTLDLFMGFGIGEFPFYEKHRQFLLSGVDGSIIYQDSIGFNGMSSPVAIDMDNDGFDEVFYHINIPVPGNPVDFSNATSSIRYYDFNDGLYEFISPEHDGISWGTTPHVKDVDGDEEVELFYAFSKSEGQSFADNSIEVVRMNLSGQPNLTAPWAAYQGSSYTSVFPVSYQPVGLEDSYDTPCISQWQESSRLDIEEVEECFNEDVNLIQLFDLTGRVVFTAKRPSELSTIESLQMGVYVCRIWFNNRRSVSKRIFLKNRIPIQ